MPRKTKKRTAASATKKRTTSARSKTAQKSGKKSSTDKSGAKRAARAATRVVRTRFVFAEVSAAQDNLDKIDHIIVLMLENRSFDHMLGYLKLINGRANVDGLTPHMSNSYNGRSYRVHALSSTVFTEDPCHSSACVNQQLRNSNGGFVENFATHHSGADPGLVMGYYNGASLPVYDHLAREFCICDRWFCPIPGATWPNRLYAVTGRSNGSKDNKRVPLYNIPSFVRHLDAAGISWNWYAHDMATLRLIDGKYRAGHFSNYWYFDKRTLLNRKNFLDHAAAGNLAAVSWIDPNFVDLGWAKSNDDHPPSDVMAGQDLVLKLYNAVVNSPAWSKSLLIITYDEHGGFYDHVVPHAAPDDSPSLRSYGPRVPAFIISPWVERSKVAKEVFDHTSIIKTILMRFCRRSDGSIPDMGERVTNANHLGTLLTQPTPRAPTPFAAYQHLVDRIAQWRSDTFKARTIMQATGKVPALREPTEFEDGIVAAKRRLRAQGLPEGQP